jgi:ankyrin repeat protein
MATTEDPVICEVVLLGRQEYADLLIKHKANLNLKGPNGNSAVLALINQDTHSDESTEANAAMLKALVAAGAKIDEKDAYDVPYLFQAATRSLPKLKLLIELKCNLNIQDGNGDTALIKVGRMSSTDAYYSGMNGTPAEIITTLVKAGADASIKNNNGLTFKDEALPENLEAFTAAQAT